MATLDTNTMYATLTETADRIRSKEISPVELTSAMLKRIEAVNPAIDAFVTVTADSAIAEAKQAEADIMAGRYKGPLHGIPIAHKDIVYTKGIRTSCGSDILRDFVPDYTAAAAVRLTEAGAVTLGKLHTHEFAIGYTSTRNPWDPKRVPGGSSSGTGAAVAAGLLFMGTGTDTGGSIRIPAAYCGVVGMKATYGRVSKYGVFPLAWSLDHIGPLTRSVKDAAVSLQAMAGYDPRDPSSASVPVPDFSAQLRQDLRGVKLGLPTDYYRDLDADTAAVMQEAIETLRNLGAEVTEFDLPAAEYAAVAQFTIMAAEAASIHDNWYETRASEYKETFRDFIGAGTTISAIAYLRAVRARDGIRRQYLDALGRFDALITPTATQIAPRIDEKVKWKGLTLGPSNTTGLPSLALPCGFSKEGMPLSMQIIGRPFDEAGVFGIGYAYEQSTSWHTRHPDL